MGLSSVFLDVICTATCLCLSYGTFSGVLN